MLTPASTLIALALSAPVGQIAEAPDRLVTPYGVELSSDGRVFVLFAALNGLGYSEETQRKGPPLAAPVYHPVRAQVREAMRKLDDEGKLAEIRKFFDANPASIDAYATALLAHDVALDKPLVELSPETKKLAGVAALVKKLGADPSFAKVYEDALVLQRRQATEMAARLDKTFGTAKKHLNLAELRAPLSIVVVPNPLDAHDSVRTVVVGPTTYLIVGPGLDSGAYAALEATLRPMIRAAVAKAYPNAAKLKKQWGEIKPLYKRIAAEYGDGDVYAAETLMGILSFQIKGILSGVPPVATAEDDFVEQQVKLGLRWTKPLMQSLAGRGTDPIDVTIGKIIPKVTP